MLHRIQSFCSLAVGAAIAICTIGCEIGDEASVVDINYHPNIGFSIPDDTQDELVERGIEIPSCMTEVDGETVPLFGPESVGLNLERGAALPLLLNNELIGTAVVNDRGLEFDEALTDQDGCGPWRFVYCGKYLCRGKQIQQKKCWFGWRHRCVAGGKRCSR